MKAKTKTNSLLMEMPCACAMLRRATRVVTQLYDDELRTTGLRATQFALLQTLKAKPGITQGAMSDVLATDSTTLSRTLRPLEKAKLITNTSGVDRRERHWYLTKAGQQRLSKAYPHWQGAQRRLRAVLAKSDWDLLFAVAGKATRAAQKA